MDQKSTSTNLTIPEAYRLKTVLDNMRTDSSLTPQIKRKLIKKQLSLLFDAFDEQSRIALEIEKDGSSEKSVGELRFG